MEYTPTGAAKAVGVGKSTVHRLIKAGTLSARRCEDGTYRIDASELARAFPDKWSAVGRGDASGHGPWDDAGQEREAPRDASETPTKTSSSNVELVELRVRVEMLERLLAREEESVADLRRRLDDANAKLLPAPVASSSPTPAPAPARRRGLLARLLGA